MIFIKDYGTVIVSFCALVVSIRTFLSQKRHDKNSVRPILDIIIGNYEDDIYVKLVNQGVGPAIITSLECLYDGDVKTAVGKSNSVINVLQRDGTPTAYEISFYNDYVESIESRTIPPNGTITLVRKKPQNDLERNALRSMLKHINIHVEYTDVYEHAYTRDRKLVAFGN